jgi:thiol:disulfide interchange protein
MALHKTQSHFARAQWKLWLLVPLWILQLLLSTAMMGLFSWRLGKTLSHHKEKQDAGQKPAIEYA